MVTKSNLIFSISSAIRILGKKIFEVRLLPFVVLVRGLLENGQRFCRFVSKKAFLNHFADRRKEAAKEINIIVDVDDSDLFMAFGNADNSKVYNLTKELRAISCTCEDYRNQKAFIQRGICKHGYAVLFNLGYASLKDYVNRDITIERVPVQGDSDLGYVTNKRSSSEPRRKGRSVD